VKIDPEQQTMRVRDLETWITNQQEYAQQRQYRESVQERCRQAVAGQYSCWLVIHVFEITHPHRLLFRIDFHQLRSDLVQQGQRRALRVGQGFA